MQPQSDPALRRRAPLVYVLREAVRSQVVLVHPGALPAKVYDTLVGELPQDCGVVVLDLLGVPEYAEADTSDGTIKGLTLDWLATRLISELPALNPEGLPYVLVGWSFGGVITHHMTCSGGLPQAPEYMVLLDSISGDDRYWVLVEELGEDVMVPWFEMLLDAKRPRPPLPGQTAAKTLDEYLELGIRRGTLLPGTSIDGLRKVYAAYVDVIRRHTFMINPLTPGHSPVPTTVVRAEHSLLPEPGTLGYDYPMVPADSGFCTVPGNHYSMFTNREAMAAVASICVPHLGIPAGAAPRGIDLESFS
jgi:hypothetical protein